MKRGLFLILCLLTGLCASAQYLGDITFGTDSTFEVVTWNVERFPKLQQITVDSVAEVIEAMDADLIAVQEIDNRGYFDLLVNNLADWDGVYVSGLSTGMAYIYRTPDIVVNNIFEIFSGNGRAFPREPLVLEMQYRGIDFVVINNHLKCCGDGFLNSSDQWDEEKRRIDAMNALKQYVDTNYPNTRVIVTGDLNDILDDVPNHNVFQAIINDGNNYLFADFPIATGSSSDWSYPTWPSHLDHHLMTNEVFGDFARAGSGVATIKVDQYLSGGMNQYDQLMSDHRPVAMKVRVDGLVGMADAVASVKQLRSAPNPFAQQTRILLDSEATDGETVVEIVDALGRIVDELVIWQGESAVVWDATAFPAGVYYARVRGLRDVNQMAKLLKSE